MLALELSFGEDWKKKMKKKEEEEDSGNLTAHF